MDFGRISRRHLLQGSAALTLGSALGARSAAAADTTIGFIYVGSRDDYGYNQAHAQGAAALKKLPGLKVVEEEKVPETDAVEKTMESMINLDGATLLFPTSFGYYNPHMIKMATKFPKLRFEHCGGLWSEKDPKNAGSYFGYIDEAQHVSGIVAGFTSKTGKLGFVAAHPIGPVNWTINGFELGAKKMNPNATTTVIFTGEWNDPVKERAAASALVDQGIDVIGQHVDTPTPQIVAQERGIYGTGHHRDLREFAPKATLCSSVWTWDKFLTPELKKVEAGNWQPNPYGAFPGIKEGGTDIACCNSVVPKDAVDKIMAERDAIIAGKQIYTGPMNDLSGKEVLAAGQPITDAGLWKMDWYIPVVITQK